jgi:hypothetical protein
MVRFYPSLHPATVSLLSKRRPTPEDMIGSRYLPEMDYAGRSIPRSTGQLYSPYEGSNAVNIYHYTKLIYIIL